MQGDTACRLRFILDSVSTGVNTALYLKALIVVQGVVIVVQV